MKKIGYIGLGKMGKSMVFHLLEKGWDVVAYNRSPEPIQEAVSAGATGAVTLKELIDKLPAPRLVWVMVSHQGVDAALEELVPLLSPGDTVIDGGNSNYKESMRRAAELKEKQIHFMDAGISGGPGGARTGASTMVGGEKEQFERFGQLFKDISVPDGYGYMGAAGAGHFVKMVHNGIEYGMMQAIAEGFAVMKKSPFELDLAKVVSVYQHGTVIESRLIDWLGKAFQEAGEELSGISGSVAHSGEGLWTVEAAQELNIPVPVIERSLKFRVDSQENPSYTGQVVSALRNQFGGHDVGEKNN